ncbi:MAG TPA: helix-turn-helix transcriptional regulator [Thermoanaerobaculia bacterium]|jgi:transcriptional regulator with XRE-family HTH domain
MPLHHAGETNPNTRGGGASRRQLAAGIGASIRDARRAQALALSDVARDADISAATLSRIENGKQSVEAALLVVLADVIGFPAASLLTGDGAAGTPVPRALERQTLEELLDTAMEQLTAVRDRLEAALAKTGRRASGASSRKGRG